MKVRSVVFLVVALLATSVQADCFFSRLGRPCKVLRVRSQVPPSVASPRETVVQPLVKIKQMVCDGKTCRLQ